MDITIIDGINSFYYYEFNDKKYYFFGDIHGHNKTSCKNVNCDYFSYTFDKVYSHNSNCTSIGVLLHTWLIYNNDYNISTDFYIEEAFTKNDYRISPYDAINKRSKNIYNLTTIFPIKQMSWLELTNYILKSCLVKEKKLCQYYPNVHIHYVDIRAIDNNRILPFYINNLYHFIIDNKLIVKDDIILIVAYLIYNYDIILNSIICFDSYDDINILNELTGRLVSQTISRFYKNKIKLFDNASVIREVNGKMIKMTRVASQLYKLKNIDNDMYHNIIEFIKDLSNEYMKPILINFKDKLNEIFKGYNKYNDEFDMLCIELFMTHYIPILTVLSAYIMDAYLLARMFTQNNSKEIITYTGSYHIEIYVGVFEIYLNQKPIIAHETNEGKCINDKKLPLYLGAKLYREHIIV